MAPTKRALAIFFFSLVMLFSAWTSKLLWLYSVFAAGMGLLLLGLLLGWGTARFLSVRRQLPAFAYEGDYVVVVVLFASRWYRVSGCLKIADTFTPEDSGSQSHVMVVRGKIPRRIEFSYRACCRRRGVYRIGPVRVRSYDPFGLFLWRRDISFFSDVKVYPRVFPVRAFPFVLGPRALRFGEQTTRQSGDYEEFFGIREYRQEDGWRRIHWRSTARLNELTVRHFEQSSQWRAMIFLDGMAIMGRGSGRDTPFEYGARIAASLAQYFEAKNAGFGLYSSGQDACRIPCAKGRRQLYRVLDALARINADGSQSCAAYLAQWQHDVPRHASLIVITVQAQFTRALDMLLRRLRVGRYIEVIAIDLDGDSFLIAPEGGRPARRGGKEYLIRRGDDLAKQFAE